MSIRCQQSVLDRERELLRKAAELWGIGDERTIRQSQKVDRLVNDFMFRSIANNENKR